MATACGRESIHKDARTRTPAAPVTALSMLLALAVLAGASHLVPVRWNSSDPKSLDLLAGTPVNCVLLESANWDAALVNSAGEHNVVTLGVLHPGKADVVEQGRHAARLKMSGVVLEGDYEPALADHLRAGMEGANLAVI